LQEGSNTLTYHAYFNGTDYEPQPGGLEDDLGFPAEIHLASVLTFYSEEGYHGAGDESFNAFFFYKKGYVCICIYIIQL